MRIAPRIDFQQTERCEDVEAYVRLELRSLTRVYAQITSCHVTIAALHRRKTEADHFEVVVDLTIAGRKIVVRRAPEIQVYEDVYVTVNNAFRVVRHRLRWYYAQGADVGAATTVRPSRLTSNHPSATPGVDASTKTMRWLLSN